ncbi:MAG: hypothetical protein GY707_01845 [Desulfobacteraceae bacterium]|nr:hypothetical protein [Desulfobacteraceae bacterium]
MNSLRASLIITLLIGAVFFLTIIAVSCNVDGENNMTITTIQQVTYYFGDASVPPEYHRSYTITVTTHKVRIVVDSYGEILADESYEITNKQFNDIQNSLKRNKVKNCILGEDKGCTGGTIERISFSDAKNEIFSGSVYHCGGEDTGNLCGDITNFANDVKNLLPNLDDLLL